MSESPRTNDPTPNDGPDFGPDLLDPITTLEGFLRLYGEQATYGFLVEALTRVRAVRTLPEDVEL